jgi:hypothetical protein
LVHEILLFWSVLAGLLCIDNLVLVPSGGDYLRFNRSGHLRYDPSSRLQARHRDLILLNPLNPFDRFALTTCVIGNLEPRMLRAANRQLQNTLHKTNYLSWIGSGYLLVLVALAAASIWFYFGDILLALLIAHLLTWVAAVLILVKSRETLGLTRFRVFSLALEASFVPGYLVNIGKRVWYRRALDIPALSLGLRRLQRMPVDSDRELYAIQLSRRLDEVGLDLNIDDDSLVNQNADDPMETDGPVSGNHDNQTTTASTSYVETQRGALRNWLKEARVCLAATSAQADGS